MKNLWGDRFYDQKTLKWSDQPTENSKRGFNLFVLEPIYKVIKLEVSWNKQIQIQMQVFKAIMGNDVEQIDQLAQKTGITLTSEERQETGKNLLKVYRFTLL